jgi:hypothetical protein
LRKEVKINDIIQTETRDFTGSYASEKDSD